MTSEPSSEMSNASAAPIVAAGWPPPIPRRLLPSIGDYLSGKDTPLEKMHAWIESSGKFLTAG